MKTLPAVLMVQEPGIRYDRTRVLFAECVPLLLGPRGVLEIKRASETGHISFLHVGLKLIAICWLWTSRNWWYGVSMSCCSSCNVTARAGSGSVVSISAQCRKAGCSGELTLLPCLSQVLAFLLGGTAQWMVFSASRLSPGSADCISSPSPPSLAQSFGSKWRAYDCKRPIVLTQVFCMDFHMERRDLWVIISGCSCAQSLGDGMDCISPIRRSTAASVKSGGVQKDW